MTDYWQSNPKAYYFRQGIVISAEIAFMVCACIFFSWEQGHECFNIQTGQSVTEPYRKAMILVIVLHGYMLVKSIYFAYAFKGKET